VRRERNRQGDLSQNSTPSSVASALLVAAVNESLKKGVQLGSVDAVSWSLIIIIQRRDPVA